MNGEETSTDIRSAAERAHQFPMRIIYSLLRPAVGVARRFNVALDVLHNLVDMAYLDELKSAESMTIGELAGVMGKSKRTVGYLLQRYREDFFSRTEELELLRTVEAEILRGRTTIDEIARVLSEGQRERLPSALEALRQAGRIERKAGENAGTVYCASDKLSSWVTDEIDSRIDGLNHQMRGISAAVWSRFIRDDGETSAVRTYGFKAKPSTVAGMIAGLIRYLRQQCVDAEEEAFEAGTGSSFLLSFSIAPDDDGK